MCWPRLPQKAKLQSTKKQNPKKRKGQTQSAVLAIRTKEVPGGVPAPKANSKPETKGKAQKTKRKERERERRKAPCPARVLRKRAASVPTPSVTGSQSREDIPSAAPAPHRKGPWHPTIQN